MLGSLLISLGLESGEFKSGLGVAEKELKATTKRIERMGKKMGDLGQKMSLAVTLPMVAIAKKSVEGFIDQEKAMADVEAALKSMGSASGKTGKELLKAADAMEMESLFDADVILKQVTANLLTFGNVAGKEFDRAQQAAIDMATRLGTEPQSAAIMLGKALNDPVKGITALTRVGVQFTDQQRKQIEAMTKAGDTAGAQAIILAEVEKQFKGAAAAAADATPWRKAQVAIGQAMDVIGEAILPIIGPIAEGIASIARAFSSLSEPMQKAVVVAAALAAALGPVLMVLGPVVTMMAPFLATIKGIAAAQGVMVAMQAGLVGIATAFGPILLGIGAVYLAWKNWDELAPRLQPLLDQLSALGEGLGLVEGKANRTQLEMAKDDGWRNLGKNLRDTSNWLQKLVDDFDAYNRENARSARENGTTLQAEFQTLWANFSQLNDNLIEWGNSVKAAFAALPSAAMDSMRNLYQGVKTWLQDRLGSVFSSVTNKIEVVRKSFFDLWDKVTRRSYVPDMVTEIGQHMARLDKLMVDPAVKATKKTKDTFRDMAAEVHDLLARLYPDIARMQQLKGELDVLDAAEARGDLSADAASDARIEANKAAGADINGNARIDPSKSTIAGPVGLDMEATERRLGKFSDITKSVADKTKVSTVRIAESFKDMAEKTMQSVRGLVDAIKGGGFLDILESAVGLFMNLAGSGVFGKGLQTKVNSVPGYATGTNSAARGWAWVGERGPELVKFKGGESVLNNSDSMKAGRGGQSIQVIPSPYFDVVVDGRVASAAPGIAGAGAQLAGQQAMFQRSRRLA